MDGNLTDHSDSDSGESWTLLEPTPTTGDLPVSPENLSLKQRTLSLNNEKDEEDTDGISIISDSDPEQSSPCELSYDCNKHLEEYNRSESQSCQYISISPLQSDIHHKHGSIQGDDDILGDNSVKHKTYVHRRNKRLSTVLNIIMLGSVITAAGVAIGHMWGAKNDCSLHTTPSVNKILSNLYKLQEENAYLRNKLKELTLANILVHQKPESQKIPLKQHRCKKVYEESINNRNVDKATKCLDNNIEHILNVPLTQPEYEKEFLHDIDKLKHVYKQNKSWLDEEVTNRMKRELKQMQNILKPTILNTVVEENIVSKEESLKDHMGRTVITGSNEKIEREFDLLKNPSHNDMKTQNKNNISYADLLKTDNQNKKAPNDNKKLNSKKVIKNTYTKKNRKGEKGDSMPQLVLSEQEFKKDDRYTAPKTKQEIKKHDRQKSHKKQKRKNKYEQWEMKGGYLKEYDVFSTSSRENEYIIKNPNSVVDNYDNINSNQMDQFNKYAQELEDNQYKNTPKNKNDKNYTKKEKDRDKKMDLTWYDKRTALRSEARKKLEQELFGESSPNNARWYFRRMQKREQCRAKGSKNSHKKLTKHEMNYKMKH